MAAHDGRRRRRTLPPSSLQARAEPPPEAWCTIRGKNGIFTPPREANPGLRSILPAATSSAHVFRRGGGGRKAGAGGRMGL